MAIVSERSVVVNLKPLSPKELVTLAEQTWSPEPDLNFEILKRWVEDGFEIVQIFWLTRYGPAYGGPGIYFILRHPDGRDFATIVVPGKKVAEFIRRYSEEWAGKGVTMELADVLVQRSTQGRD